MCTTLKEYITELCEENKQGICDIPESPSTKKKIGLIVEEVLRESNAHIKSLRLAYKEATLAKEKKKL